MLTLLEYLDLLAEFFEGPDAGARRVAARLPVGLGVLCFLLSGSTLVVAQALNGGVAQVLFKLLPWGAVLVFSGLLPLLSGFLLAGILHLTAELLGARRGTAAAMFVLLGLSQLLYVLFLPIVLTTEIFSESPGAWRGAGLFVLGAVSLYLKVASIRSNYGFSTGRAGAVLVLPYTAGLAVLAAGLAAMVGGAVSVANLFD